MRFTFPDTLLKDEPKKHCDSMFKRESGDITYYKYTLIC